MEKFLVYIFSILIILLGVPNMATCVNYALDRSGVVGSKGDLEKNDLATQDLKGYSITYNLDGGTLVKVNPDYYTLFSEDFTLNNPTKEGCEFLGWTGSNGEEPQLTVTICKGSAGNLEFTANYIRQLDEVVLELNEATLSWNKDDKVEEYDVYVNGTNCLTVNTNSIDVHSLDEYFHIGDGNEVYVLAKATDYKDSKSNVLKYVYYDLTDFENLQFKNIYFTRTSYKYILLNSTAQVEYSLSGEYLGGYIKSEELKDKTVEEAIMYGFNSEHEYYSTLQLADCTVFELLQLIDSSYDGYSEVDIDVSGKFKFAIDDTLKTIYTPAKLTLRVKYNEMYAESSFHDGVSLDLADCASVNKFAVGFGGYSGQSTFLTEVILTDVDGQFWKFAFYDEFENDNQYYQINGTNYSASSLNTTASALKFYLNDDYYFMINGNMSDLIQALYQDAGTKRGEYEASIGNTEPEAYSIWSWDSMFYTLNLNQYFNVYSADGVEVTFNYTLFTEYETMRYL